VAELRGWLGGPFRVLTAHLGRPRRSLTTLLVGGLRKLRARVRRALGPGAANENGVDSPGVLDLLRLVCTARDRYHLFMKARRAAAAGGIALCERYPIPQNRLLVGPEIARLLGHGRETALARWLLRAELSYYRRITPPDVVLVLMVDPEVAVQRKTTEPPDYVRARARIIWETEWTATGAHLVDAGRSLPESAATAARRERPAHPAGHGDGGTPIAGPPVGASEAADPARCAGALPAAAPVGGA
jgi:hypothetical protein